MSSTFADLGTPAPIAQRLAQRGITEPFPIQVATIPDALDGLDLCGKAPTGSGKTLAFGIPMVAKVTRSAPKRPKGLVLAPTRELALQVAEEIRSLSGDHRVLAVYGGAGIEPQIKKLRAGVDIVVACPGRLLDVIDRKACDLRDVGFAVVDEADRMADMGFLPDVKKILDQTNDDRQTLLFSATLDGAIDALVKRYQHDPVIHEMADEETGDIVHHLWTSERPDRVQLTAEIIERVGPTIVFSRTRHGADRIAKQIGRLGVTAAPIHGGRSQGQRERALDKFHRGEVMALVATDVAARGIHVEGVQCVIHYDIPADHKDYVHRSGRTGRAGNDGTVVALVPTAQRRDAAKIMRLAGIDVDISDPVVGDLPEGHQAFTAASRTKGDSSRRSGPNAKDANQRRGRDDRGPSGRPASRGGSRPGQGEGQRRGAEGREAGRDGGGRTHHEDRPTSRSERPDRTDRSDRTDRPDRAERPDRTERPKRPAEHRSSRPTPAPASDKDRVSAKTGGKHGGSGENRAERRRERFGASDSDERKARAAAKQPDGKRSEAKRSNAKRSEGKKPAGGENDALERTLDGSSKVRPSGASRRKAKRQAQLDAGEEPTRSKKRRSGKPRSAADQRTR